MTVATVKAICPAPGCGRLTNGGRCDEHERERNAEKNARRIRRVYDSDMWPLTRRLTFHRDQHTCVNCGRHRDELGERETLVCAHVDPIEQLWAEGRNPFDEAECKTLCSHCSGSEDGGRARRR